MKKVFTLLLIVLPLFVSAQNPRYVGVNLLPLMLNTLEVRFQQQLLPSMAVTATLGGRYQNRENKQGDVFLSALGDYIDIKNTGAFVTVGVQAYDSKANESPYFGLSFVSSYYNERVITGFDPDQVPIIEDVSGVSLGVTGEVGLRLKIAKGKLLMNLGLQLGYIPVRKDILSYYTGGAGFSTFGFGILSVRGLHAQPTLTFSYNIAGEGGGGGRKPKGPTID